MRVAEDPSADAADSARDRVEPDTAPLAFGRNGRFSQKPHDPNLADRGRRRSRTRFLSGEMPVVSTVSRTALGRVLPQS